MRFQFAWMLLGLPIWIAGVVWLWRRSFVGLPRGQMRAALVVRALVGVLLLLAAARPEARLGARRPPVVALVDVSDSIPDDVLARERDLLARAWAERGDRPFDVVTFAGVPRLDTADGAPRLERHDGLETDLARAIVYAARPRKEGAAHVLLFSDGRETRGDARAAAAAAFARGSTIDVVRMPGAPPRDARVTDVRPPDVVRRGEPTRIAVTVASTVAGRARVELTEDDLLVEGREEDLPAGVTTVDFDVAPSRAGFLRYAARVTLPGDNARGNDAWDRLVLVGGEPRVLLCADSADEGTHLEQALRANGLDVESRPPDALPASVEGLSSYDAVILAGVPSSSLDRLRQGALARYVRDLGGGLVIVGGPKGLTRGRGAADPVETMLPVDLAEPSERQVPPVALVMLIDRSGSMTGEKLVQAKLAARQIVDHLSENAELGVIAFDADFQWIVPLQAIERSERRDAIKSGIDALGSGGGTRFYPALEDAYFALGASAATAKHMILLTDGESTDPIQLPSWLPDARARGITVSTVGIGKKVDRNLLASIASAGGGVYHPVADASEVPRIFLDEAKTIESEAVRRGDVQARVAEAVRELSGVEFATAPKLRGYVRTRPKPTAEVLLETERRDPLLARWRYGLGSVLAFTSDATSRWATDWLAWEGFGKMWTQLVRGAARGRPRHDIALGLTIDGGALALEAEAIGSDGRFLDDLSVKAIVLDGGGQRHEIALAQSGPGRYAARVPAPPGSLVARPVGARGDRALGGDWVILSRPYPRELADVGDDERALDALAAAGGGERVVASSPAELVATGARPGQRVVPLSRALLLLAFMLFLGDVAVKRSRRRRAE